MTLKTSAENGSSSAGRRESSCSVRGSIPWIGGTSERARQVVDDRVEQRLDALVLERGAGEAPA
jgi:hypothetical protein